MHLLFKQRSAGREKENCVGRKHLRRVNDKALRLSGSYKETKTIQVYVGHLF